VAFCASVSLLDPCDIRVEKSFICYNGGNPPANLLIALDHTVFIGVMTNALFGLIYEATTERRSFWSWADHVLFLGMNIGVTGFIISLLTNIPSLERIFTPIMGLSILLGLLTYGLRMRNTPTAEQASVAGAS
jgi:predicted membrane channel-forming protein YqfA (hemolysin III family)